MKINQKKFGLSALAASILLMAAAIAWSQQPAPPTPGGFPGPPPDGFQGPPGGAFRGPNGPRQAFGPFGPFGRELNLTDDQKSQIKKITDSFRESDKALFDQMRALHEGQADPMTSEFNEAAVRSTAEARAKVQVELEVSHAKMMSQIASILTAEQKATLAAHHQQMQRMAPPPPPAEPPL